MWPSARSCCGDESRCFLQSPLPGNEKCQYREGKIRSRAGICWMQGAALQFILQRPPYNREQTDYLDGHLNPLPDLCPSLAFSPSLPPRYIFLSLLPAILLLPAQTHALAFAYVLSRMGEGEEHVVVRWVVYEWSRSLNDDDGFSSLDPGTDYRSLVLVAEGIKPLRGRERQGQVNESSAIVLLLTALDVDSEGDSIDREACQVNLAGEKGKEGSSMFPPQRGMLNLVGADRYGVFGTSAQWVESRKALGAGVVALKGCGRKWCAGSCSGRAGRSTQTGCWSLGAAARAARSSKLEIELFGVFERGLEEARLLKVVRGTRNRRDERVVGGKGGIAGQAIGCGAEGVDRRARQDFDNRSGRRALDEEKSIQLGLPQQVKLGEERLWRRGWKRTTCGSRQVFYLSAFGVAEGFGPLWMAGERLVVPIVACLSLGALLEPVMQQEAVFTSSACQLLPRRLFVIEWRSAAKRRATRECRCIFKLHPLLNLLYPRSLYVTPNSESRARRPGHPRLVSSVWFTSFFNGATTNQVQNASHSVTSILGFRLPLLKLPPNRRLRALSPSLYKHTRKDVYCKIWPNDRNDECRRILSPGYKKGRDHDETRGPLRKRPWGSGIPRPAIAGATVQSRTGKAHYFLFSRTARGNP
ncbi:hypothetical protein DFP72DRAFT_1040356 [Ephemerocybe angulata]|uniref:Uncharacterized protein n=1 Tax=Ephemerocybe angulata TaxID=980116 RepID=A0A8H6MF38_9AGAR|nr:hypothetical protein DFP72DRAFT_1040356 [Tulosesus angulatus]